MSERIKSLFIYAAKCITGTLAVFAISNLYDHHDISWALISVVLVLSPDGKDAVPLAVTRIKANFVGVSIAVLCLLICEANMFTVSIALAITLSICYLLKLDTGIKSALAATVIIMLHHEGAHLWNTALERVISVLSGCLLGLIITFLFHFNFKKARALHLITKHKIYETKSCAHYYISK